MNQRLKFVKSIAIRQLLWIELQAAIDLYLQDATVLLLKPRHLSLQIAKGSYGVFYISSIALQLSQTQNIPAAEVARALAKIIRNSAEPNFNIQVAPSGLIYFELTEQAIASWLEYLVFCCSKPTHLYPVQKKKADTVKSCLFTIQYAHARCCSLVQMAHREGLITLKQIEPDLRSGFIPDYPQPFPWLDSNQQLWLSHPDERVLITQLLAVVDDLYFPCASRQPINWTKAALNLSQAFQAFYKTCRIWGEVKIQTLDLAQARLGLVISTQILLRILLQERLGSVAPLEL